MSDRYSILFHSFSDEKLFRYSIRKINSNINKKYYNKVILIKTHLPYVIYDKRWNSNKGDLSTKVAFLTPAGRIILNSNLPYMNSKKECIDIMNSCFKYLHDTEFMLGEELIGAHPRDWLSIRGIKMRYNRHMILLDRERELIKNVVADVEKIFSYIPQYILDIQGRIRFTEGFSIKRNNIRFGFNISLCSCYCNNMKTSMARFVYLLKQEDALDKFISKLKKRIHDIEEKVLANM